MYIHIEREREIHKCVGTPWRILRKPTPTFHNFKVGQAKPIQNPGEVPLHWGFCLCRYNQEWKMPNRLRRKGSGNFCFAVKNCYPAKIPWPSPAQNAAAESKGASSPRSVLTDVNKSHSQRFDPLSQPLVCDAIPRDHPLFTGYRSPTGGRLFRGRTA